jgi:hypothetical protein
MLIKYLDTLVRNDRDGYKPSKCPELLLGRSGMVKQPSRKVIFIIIKLSPDNNLTKSQL